MSHGSPWLTTTRLGCLTGLNCRTLPAISRQELVSGEGAAGCLRVVSMFQSGQYQQTLVAVLYSLPELQVPAQRPFLLEPAFGGGRIRYPWIVPSKPFAHVLMIDCQSIFYWCGCCKKNQVKNRNANAVAGHERGVPPRRSC